MNKINFIVVVMLGFLNVSLQGSIGSSRIESDPDELLYNAVQEGNVELALSCIEQGADIRGAYFLKPVPGKLVSFPLLFDAVRNGHIAMVKCLIEHGADVNQMVGFTTPFMHLDFMQRDPKVTDTKIYLQLAGIYFKNNIVVEDYKQEDIKPKVPHYCLLAVIKNNHHDIGYYFDPQFDYSHYIKHMQLPENKNDGGIYELMWHYLKQTGRYVAPNELFCEKNPLKLLTHYNLYKKIKDKKDVQFYWQ